MSKRIVIISATIFPRNTPRAHRATELAKELSLKGHNVTLYGILGKYDYSNFENEHDLKVRNLGDPIFYPINSDGETRSSIFFKVFNRVLRPIFQFPDLELMFWVKKVLMRERECDILITNAIPHTIHWGASWAKKSNIKLFPKTWIADCGDPFMGNEFQKPFFYFKYLEKWFCKNADFISVPLNEAKRGYYPEFQSKLVTIPQGFNFSNLNICKEKPRNSVPTFLYAGAFYPGKRDPREFLKFLQRVELNFKFIIYSRNTKFLDPYIQKLNNKVEVRPYIERNELLKVMSEMDFLINFENNTTLQSPSKLIDYYLVNRPILSISNHNFASKNFEEFLNGNYQSQLVLKDFDKYNIKNVADKFLDLAS